MKKIILAILPFVLTACNSDDKDYDAMGTFEATEVIVSAEQNGRLINFDVEEGNNLNEGQPVGTIDTVQLYLRARQLGATRQSYASQRPDISKQTAATIQQLKKAEMERDRYAKLVKDNAANKKLLDDAENNVRVLRRQLEALRSSLDNSTGSLDKQMDAVEIERRQVLDQLEKCHIKSPINGTVLEKYAEAMHACGVKKLIFSSSSTVYGTPVSLPLTEDMPTGTPTNPYGRTKLMIEEILRDLCTAQPDFSAVCLRYFNPIGAHASGLIGEDPNGIPNNLLPYVARVASGKLEYVRVFGNDYPTPDGTGVRDYIHVVDLARGHVDSLDYADKHVGWEAINLGTGRGSSVLEVIEAFEKACGKKLPYKILPRRAGDIAANWCCPDKAEKLLGWKAQYGIAEMCASSWKFEQLHAKNN